MVVGSFIIGLDADEPGVGERIADMADRCGRDNLNVLFLTPLPGTRLWDRMKEDGRIALNTFPEDWKSYTLTYPVARYKNLFLDAAIRKMISCNRSFYSIPYILRRLCGNVWKRRAPLISIVANLSYRSNIRVDCEAYADFKNQRGYCFNEQVACIKIPAPGRPKNRKLSPTLVSGQYPGANKTT
jgi:radical SAM superfamily enzyme YgiQ (UPF0313 family)